MKSNKSGNFTWAVVFAWIFGIGGVAGVMYLLFTNEDYNGMGGAKVDSSLMVKLDSPKDGSNYNSYNNAGAVDNSKKNTATKPVEKEKDAIPEVKKEPAKPVPVKPVEQVAPKPVPVAPKPVPVAPKPVPVVVPKPQPKPVPVVVTKPQPKPVPVVIPKPQPKPVPVVVPKPPAPIAKAATTPQAKPKPVVHKADKVMSEGDLSQLVSKIVQSGADNGIYSKCVQLHSTSDGNNKKTLQQVENYLRSQKYSIAGRQVVSSHVNGIKVTPANGCMRVLIGSF